MDNTQRQRHMYCHSWNSALATSNIAFNTKFQLSASIPSLEQPLIICPIPFNLILQQDNYELHPTTQTFVTPHVNTKTFGESSFSYTGPSVWNSLPQTLRHSDSASSFKAALKTHPFSNYFWTIFFTADRWLCVCYCKLPCAPTLCGGWAL